VVEVGIAQLRRELKDWLERAGSGDEVVITERGRPIARLTGIDVAPLLDQLTQEGQISPAPDQPRASARDLQRVAATGDVAPRITAERDANR